ncbi:MAG: 4-hydroxy-3-methylbut-2-enyl diphosphate reductase [Coriobacteriia bacterium]
MQVRIAKPAGTCYGVERALKLAQEAAHSGAPVHTLGPLIHNPQAVSALKRNGVEVAETLDDAIGGILVIRSHGVEPATIAEARRRGLEVVDATCPHVSKAHQAAAELSREGYSVVIVGEAEHPEVEGILAHADGTAIVVSSAEELPARLPSLRIGIVVQTTQSLRRLGEIVGALLPRTNELRVFNTICSATSKRQQAAEELAEEVDVMVVVGGHNSGNTTRLAEICRSVNPRVHHVETPEELDPVWFEGAEVVGVTAGASTPEEQMQDVARAIEAMG